MVANTDAAFNSGNMPRELRKLQDRVAALEARRDLESASIGTGGLAVKGGSIVIYDASGNETMRLSTDGLSMQGVLAVLGEIGVTGGGDVRVTDGSLVASDSDGDVFRVDPTVPEIFMRQSLISDLARQIIADTLSSESVGPGVSTGSTSYTALSGGPSVSAEVSDAGRMLVTIGANIFPGSWDSGGDIFSLAYLGFDVSGASSVSADDLRALHVGAVVSSGAPTAPVRFAATRQVMLTGLSAGSHTVAARYRVDVSGSGTINNATFSGRSVTVQAF